MRIPATIQHQREDGKLECKGAGHCIIYGTSPGKGSKVKPYVSVNLGEFRLHLDSVEFSKFCRKFLYDRDATGLLLKEDFLDSRKTK